MNKKTWGFTLVEMMVAVAIVGVLAKIAIPVYKDYMIKVHLNEMVVQLKELKNIATLCSQNGECKMTGGGGYTEWDWFYPMTTTNPYDRGGYSGAFVQYTDDYSQYCTRVIYGHPEDGIQQDNNYQYGSSDHGYCESQSISFPALGTRAHYLNQTNEGQFVYFVFWTNDGSFRIGVSSGCKLHSNGVGQKCSDYINDSSMKTVLYGAVGAIESGQINWYHTCDDRVGDHDYCKINPIKE